MVDRVAEVVRSGHWLLWSGVALAQLKKGIVLIVVVLGLDAVVFGVVRGDLTEGRKQVGAWFFGSGALKDEFGFLEEVLLYSAGLLGYLFLGLIFTAVYLGVVKANKEKEAPGWRSVARLLIMEWK